MQCATYQDYRNGTIPYYFFFKSWLIFQTFCFTLEMGLALPSWSLISLIFQLHQGAFISPLCEIGWFPEVILLL